MKISVAQTKPFKGAVQKNIETHKKLITMAISHGVAVIIFPELSLTGYEPDLVNDLATNQDDKIFDDFQELSNNNNIIIGVGMPTKSSSGILISMIIFQANKPRQTYSKQHLHEDEFPYFVHGTTEVMLNVNDIKIAPAICYESMLDEHSEKAFKNGASIYITSVAKTANGIEKTAKHYPKIAQKYAMPILMSNCVGFCDNFESVGQSAIWNNQGNIIGSLDSTHEGILIFDTNTQEITKEMLLPI
jgi:predicted amidohydrolase